MLVAFPQSWAGITAMVRCTLSLRTGSGGAVLCLMVRNGTTWLTMVVAYIPTTPAATMGSTCGAFRPPSMASTSAKVSSS